MAKTQARHYKIVNHITGKVRVIFAYNSWMATEYAARDDFSCEVCKTAEAIELTKQGIEIEYAVKQNVASSGD